VWLVDDALTLWFCLSVPHGMRPAPNDARSYRPGRRRLHPYLRGGRHQPRPERASMADERTLRSCVMAVVAFAITPRSASLRKRRNENEDTAAADTRISPIAP
jgi:hypothetical protein